MQKAWDKLKEKFEEEPLQVLAVGALFITATAKLIDSGSNAVSRRTWSREVARRERMKR